MTPALACVFFQEQRDKEMMDTVILPLVGGVLIGAASALVMLYNGRIAGISGIVEGVIAPKRSGEHGELGWRVWFLAGLLVMGGVLMWLRPESFPAEMPRSTGAIAVAGLLVGFGTRLGSGCTSGHGVCGMSRFSVRSIVATATFMFAGGVTVAVIRHMLGGTI